LTTALLEIQEVDAGYGETEILHGVSAHVDPEEIVVVIGPNGAGKSTLIKAVIGILKPTRGEINFRGARIRGRDPEDLVHEGLAYIPQVRNIFPNLTVRENFEMGWISRRRTFGATVRSRLLPGAGRSREGGGEGPSAAATLPMTEKEEFDARVGGIVAIFPNLRPKLRARAGSLSGGEQQMVALGKALVLDPILLLIDEPSAGLAPRLVTIIFDKIKEINERGTAILLVEQNARRALAMADRGYVLEMGRNRYEGKGEALLRDPEVGRLYLGG